MTNPASAANLIHSLEIFRGTRPSVVGEVGEGNGAVARH
jgi:hypothetical protein